MDSQMIVSYDLHDLLSDKHINTESREEAIGYYERGWDVYENHEARFRVSPHSTSMVIVTMRWNDNPDMEDKIYAY